MNHIDKLLIQARKSLHPSVFSAMCFIERDIAGKWTAKPGLWDGIPGSGFVDDEIPADWVSIYDTAAEAVEAANQLFESLHIEYDNRTVIVVDDMSG